MARMRYDALLAKVRNLAPEERDLLDSPYTISNELYAALRAVPHDVGGQPDTPQPYLEKEEEEWEMNTYLTCECLAWRGGWNAEMRRRAENDLGATLYFGMPYYARWITVAARFLVDQGLITTDELSAKIDEVRTRLEASR
ncbi:SH3-like domain-containing protein [Nonomuraea africana]|uniref:Nitrile hydratase beta subunit-like N-terminal domain-containing protein n=1 Tax=Nonomuraea africana TaxID=46171 RepID=A0ABR9KVK8_9ACTN|nr:SH3-like domain-containing protein [Nonomuraea africana]MBE1566060.1 hypothetical protein [Nonomuraea africana]